MIALIIFYVHIVAFAAAYTREYQKEGLSAGFLNLGFMILIFSVGWSISTFVLKYLIGSEGFGRWLDRDALSLLVLTIGEGLFYYYYYKDEKKQAAV